MRLRLPTLLLLIPLAACGGGNWQGSSLNPSNWFGGRQPDAVVPVATALPSDPRPMVDKILSMHVESFPGGVIVRATGLPPTQAYWNADLVALPVDDKGTLVLEFHLSNPTVPAPANTQRSREITVAYTLTDFALREVSRIEVRGARNSLSEGL